MIGIYARVSTEEQAKSGFSLKDQIRECQKKAASDEVKLYVDEGISGEFLDRPALISLRQDAREGILSKVICLDPDRLSRKLINQLIITEELEKRGVELVFVNGEYAKTPEGYLFYAMRGAIAEFEKAKITERMSRGRREKARQGRVLRDFRIYGYDYDSQTEQLVINEDEGPVVQIIFDLFTQPNDLVQGINGIAKYLTQKGIPTKRGASIWHRQVVRQMLMNEVYVGKFYQNRWNTEGMLGNQFKSDEDKVPMKKRPKEEWILLPCPAIIGEGQFYLAQEILSESRRRWSGTSKHQYLLSGLLRCGECGNTMTGRRTKNWGKYVYEYTDVKNTAGAKNKGCGMRVRCDVIDNEVWNKIVEWLNNPEAIESFSNQPSQNNIQAQSNREKYQNRLDKIREGKKRLFGLYAKGEEGLGETELREMIKEFTDEEEKILKNISENHYTGQNMHKDKAFQDILEFYLGRDSLVFKDRKEIIRRLIRELVIRRSGVEAHLL